MQENLIKLIKFKTVSSDYKENDKALDWVVNKIKNLPVYIKKERSNNYSSLIITTKKTRNPIIWLSAHIDVVPGPDEIFIPIVKRNKLYGRGAFDMKFAISCYLKLLNDLGKELSDYNFGLMIVTDEEITGNHGTKFILDKGYRSKICFLPDAGANWKFETGAKATWNFIVQSKGKTAHSSRPWEGYSAIENLIEFISILKKKFPKDPCASKEHYHKTINIGKISGGESSNMVSGYAEALVNIRLIPDINSSEFKEKVYSLKKNFKNIKIKELSFKDGYKINHKNNYYINLFSAIAFKKFKIKTSYIFSHGSSETFFFNKKKIPVVMIQPKGGGQHSNKEWIDVKDLERYYLVLKEFVKVVSKV